MTNDAMTNDERMTPNDPMTLISRDNTYVKPDPVTNWEWEREEDGGEFLK